MLTTNDYIIMSYDVAEYADYIQNMDLKELENEKIDLMEIFNHNLKKRDDIIKQIEKAEFEKNHSEWLIKAKSALKFCKRDLNKINMFLAVIKEKIKFCISDIQEEKFSQILKQKYPDIYKEIVDIIKNR